MGKEIWVLVIGKGSRIRKTVRALVRRAPSIVRLVDNSKSEGFLANRATESVSSAIKRQFSIAVFVERARPENSMVPEMMMGMGGVVHVTGLSKARE
jgi:hypothetical protein